MLRARHTLAVLRHIDHVSPVIMRRDRRCGGAAKEAKQVEAKEVKRLEVARSGQKWLPVRKSGAHY
jgi:hypothetical protein